MEEVNCDEERSSADMAEIILYIDFNNPSGSQQAGKTGDETAAVPDALDVKPEPQGAGSASPQFSSLSDAAVPSDAGVGPEDFPLASDTQDIGGGVDPWDEEDDVDILPEPMSHGDPCGVQDKIDELQEMPPATESKKSKKKLEFKTPTSREKGAKKSKTKSAAKERTASFWNLDVDLDIDDIKAGCGTTRKKLFLLPGEVEELVTSPKPGPSSPTVSKSQLKLYSKYTRKTSKKLRVMEDERDERKRRVDRIAVTAIDSFLGFQANRTVFLSRPK
jgi:hypothetical protein